MIIVIDNMIIIKSNQAVVCFGWSGAVWCNSRVISHIYKTCDRENQGVKKFLKMQEM